MSKTGLSVKMYKRMFIYELPYSVRKSLCLILDAVDKWEELGGEHMGFDYTYLQSIRRRESSPTDNLLTEWGNQNHTVTELFILLSKMQNYRAMSLIKDFVNENYHHLLREGEELLSQTSSMKGLHQASNMLNHRQCSNHDQNPTLQDNSLTATKVPVLPFPQFNGDNKDLGLSLQNMNLADQKLERKVKCKTLNEAKLQNIQGLQTRQPDEENRSPSEERRFSDVSTMLMEGHSPRIDFSELESATNGWDTSCIIGRGGFGTVYKGTWKNTVVAIKKLENLVCSWIDFV